MKLKQDWLNKFSKLKFWDKLKPHKSGLDKPQWDKKKKIFIALICVAIVYLDFAFLINQQMRSIRKITPQIIKLKRDLKDLINDLNNMEALKKNAAEAQENMLSKTKKIISEEQLTSLLNDLSQAANNNNVQILEIRPSKESGGKLEKSGGTAKFSPLLVKLELVCDYHNLGRFINTLENSPTFIAVQDINISSLDSDLFKQKVVLILRTYVRK